MNVYGKTYGFVCGYCVDLCAKHDASEEREEKTLKYSKESEDED